jgi:hypothetical protein
MIYPMFAMVLLTAAVLATLFRARVSAVRSGQLKQSYFKIYQGQLEPESSAKAARHFANLFEAPILFYVGCLAAMSMHQTGAVMQALAWTFVAARGVHAYVHLGRNKLQPRIAVYMFSWAVLLAMWIYLVVGSALSRGG